MVFCISPSPSSKKEYENSLTSLSNYVLYEEGKGVSVERFCNKRLNPGHVQNFACPLKLIIKE